MILDENNSALIKARYTTKTERRRYTGHNIAVYILGAILGSFFNDFVLDIAPYDIISGTADFYVIKTIMPFLLLLLFATSCVGGVLITVLFLTEGFSVSFTEMSFLKSGMDVVTSFVATAIPAALKMTALFYLGGIAMRKALEQNSFYRQSNNGKENSVTFVQLFIAAIFTAGAGFSTYYLSVLMF